MPDTMRPSPRVGAPALVATVGWELHFDRGSSDKYYRVVLASGKVVVNYGRSGSAGSLVVHDMGTPARAREKALTLTGEKEAKGYYLTRDTAPFRAPASLIQAARSGGGTEPETRAARELISLFISASAGASR